MPLTPARVVIFSVALAFCTLPARLCSQSPQDWVTVGNQAVSQEWGLSGSMRVIPGTATPLIVYQENGSLQSRAYTFNGTSWTRLGTDVSHGTGWYHAIAFGYPPGETLLQPFVFLREYSSGIGGFGVGDGLLSYFSASLPTPDWVRSTIPATTDTSHFVSLDINTANPASPFFNVPVVSFADRQFNTGVLTNPALIEEDPLSVKKYVFGSTPGTGTWVPLGTAGTGGPALTVINGGPPTPIGPMKYTSVRVSSNGTVYVSGMHFSVAHGYRPMTVYKLDLANDVFVPVGNVEATGVFISGVLMLSANNGMLVLDRNELPWIAFTYWDKVVVMKYDEATETWVVVGGFATATDSMTLYDSAWRYRVGLAFDAANRPCVFYALTALDPVNQSKAVVRRFENGSWNAIGSVGFSPGGASYLSLDVDMFDNIHAGFRNMQTGRFRDMRFENPFLFNGPEIKGSGFSTSLATNPIPVLSAPSHPRAAHTFAFSVLGTAPLSQGIIFVANPSSVPTSLGLPGLAWYGDLESTTPFLPFNTDLNGNVALGVSIPNPVPPLTFVLGAAAFDANGLAFSQSVRIQLLPDNYF